MAKANSTSVFSGLTVLVVEDESFAALELEQTLEEAGCIVLGPVALAITLGLLDTFRQEQPEKNVRPNEVFPSINLSRNPAQPRAEMITK